MKRAKQDILNPIYFCLTIDEFEIIWCFIIDIVDTYIKYAADVLEINCKFDKLNIESTVYKPYR